MVSNMFFVISFLPTLCSRFKVGRSFAGCSADYYIRESRMFQENSKDVPQNTILGREDWVICTWKLHHLLYSNTYSLQILIYFSNTYFIQILIF